jgi:pimeloyl-ACP methyl ester carboxylesterase
LNLCGLSLGGMLALHFAIDNPEKVKTLTLIGTQYKMPKTLLKFQNIVFSIMPKSVFKNMGFQKKDIICLTNSMIDLDFSAKLKDVACNTLILCGTKDSANKKASKCLAESIIGSELKLIENAGHEVNKDNPKALALELESFYRK